MESAAHKPSALERPLIWAGVTALILLVVAGVLFLALRPTSPIPSSIRKQISFVIYVPTSPWSVNPKDVSFLASGDVLTVHAKNGSDTLTITEQAAPSQFTDIPQYFPALLNKLNEYQSIGSANGTGYLTHPTELKGFTEAVLNNNGTLMFISQNHNISTDAWRQFFNNLKVIK